MEREALKKALDKIVVEVVKHTEAINKVLTDVADLKEKDTRIIDSQDKMMVVLERLDQERMFLPLRELNGLRMS